MKRIILYLAMAATATGQVVNLTNQQERAALPTGAVILGDMVYVNPSFTELQPLGWRYQSAITNPGPGYVVLGRTWVDADGINATAILTTRTTNEQAQIDASNAVAQAAAEAAMPPWEFPRGIALPDITQTNPVYAVGVDAGDVVTWVAHSSPYDPAVAASNKAAALSARRQIKQDLKAVKTNLAVVVDNITTNINNSQAIVVNATSSTTQVRSAVIDLRRELIDANQELKSLAQLVQDLRKAQADALKEANP